MDLLVGDGSPKIADYAGRGELVGWLRVTATRKALSLLRKTNREESLDDVLLDHWPDTGGDPSEQHLRAKYAAELKRAIHQAFADLEVRQRNLLRQHILDELTIDDLARLYRAHRATCARWVADAREILPTSSVVRPIQGSCEAMRARPESITATMPSIVTEVSATLVERITLRLFPGAIAASC
jgi:RNA polymerase sigma-70 factor